MIYSRWRPADGKYDYFESRDQVGLGDDMPVPSLPIGSAIGVPSVAVGRKPAGAMRRVGSGEAPLGSILPTTEGLGFAPDRGQVYLALALLSGVVVGYLMRGASRA